MISVDQAKKIINRNCAKLPIVRVPLEEACGASLAEDILSPVDLPPFRQSSMDGYAIRADEFSPGRIFPVTGIAPAGKPPAVLGEGAIRIFTGAPLPEGADTVIMQEEAEPAEGGIRIRTSVVEKGGNVRQAGAEIRRNSVAMRQGAKLNPSAIGYLAGMGITEVPVCSFPKISLLITGDELVRPGKAPESGQVYESASFAIRAAIKTLPAKLVAIHTVPDDLDKLTKALLDAAETSDIILTTGGISVGDFDFTAQACCEAGIEKLFHCVKQKPGKPLFFGKRDAVLMFGLPGNPASVLTCFYQYVVPAIEIMTGTYGHVREITAGFSGSYAKKQGFTHFLKGKLSENMVMPSTAQESYRLSSFALADCLIRVEENTLSLTTGDRVTVYVLP
jgi:molybdopterin molybdotransferase